MRRVCALHRFRRAATLRDTVDIGFKRPPRRLAKLKNVISTLEVVSRLTPVLTLSVSPVLARTHNGARQILITFGPVHSPTNAIARPFLITMDTAPVRGAASS